ncbi:MAG: hypothetical protein KDN22_04680 [Verrucomicrobiae bacterium]|nr:hypothetical protein [Verrucomicrobiae bacterium]
MRTASLSILEFCARRNAFAALAVTASLLLIPAPEAAAGVMLLDAAESVTQSAINNRTNWKLVPSDLLALEADPLKARSDPAYYGRKFVFAGDAVVENDKLTAIFNRNTGQFLLYPKPLEYGPVVPILKFAPFAGSKGEGGISSLEILRNAGDEVVLKAVFSNTITDSSKMNATDVAAIFTFDKSEIVEIKPVASPDRLTLTLMTSIDYGIVPGFIGDDLIYATGKAPKGKAVPMVAENMFMGLVHGENQALIMTWPPGNQQLHFTSLDGEAVAVDLDTDGKSVYVAALQAPGIWHREELKATHLEKEVAVNWKPPFPAKWKTQLSESGTTTTYAFRDSASEIWRGVPGKYRYPAWFSGSDALYFLSKKIPPKGESIIYFTEGQNTPSEVTTPVDIMKATLGRELGASILDSAGQKLRTHHRRGHDGVRRACTCGGTEAVQAIFETGSEVAERLEVAEVMEDTVYFVQEHLKRIDEYQAFAATMIASIQAKGTSHPKLKPYLQNLEQIAQQIPQECSVQKENMKSLAHARELARRTVSLTRKKAPENLKAYMELLAEWRAMGGAQDYVLAQCHTIARKLAQEAGYQCPDTPGAVAIAKDIRQQCRQILRNPDGYEIWPNY